MSCRIKVLAEPFVQIEMNLALLDLPKVFVGRIIFFVLEDYP